MSTYALQCTPCRTGGRRERDRDRFDVGTLES
jgi:hypothetical protein